MEISQPGEYLRGESQSLFNDIGSRRAMQSFAKKVFSNPLKWEVDDSMALVILQLPLLYTMFKYLREYLIKNREYTIDKVNELKEQAKELKDSRSHIVNCMSTVKAFVKLVSKRKFGIRSCKLRRQYRIKKSARKWSRRARLRCDRHLESKRIPKFSSESISETKETLNNTSGTSGYVSNISQCSLAPFRLDCSANTMEISFATGRSEDADCPIYSPLQTTRKVNLTGLVSPIPPHKVSPQKSKSCSDLKGRSFDEEFDPTLPLAIEHGDNTPVEQRQSTPKKLKISNPVFELPMPGSLNLSIAVVKQESSLDLENSESPIGATDSIQTNNQDFASSIRTDFLLPFSGCFVHSSEEDVEIPEILATPGEECPGTLEEIVSLDNEDVIVEIHYQNPDYKGRFNQKLPDTAYIDSHTRMDSPGDDNMTSFFPSDAEYSDTSHISNESSTSEDVNCSPISSIDSADVCGKIMRPGAGFMKAPTSIEDKISTDMLSPLSLSSCFGRQDSVDDNNCNERDLMLELIGSNDSQSGSTGLQIPDAAMFQGMSSFSSAYSDSSSSGTSFVPSDVWSPRYSSSESSDEERKEDKPGFLQTVKSLVPSASPITPFSKKSRVSNSTGSSFGFRRLYRNDKNDEAIVESNREDVVISMKNASSESDSIESIKDSIDGSTSEGPRTKPDVKTIVIVSDDGSSFRRGFEVATPSVTHHRQNLANDKSSDASIVPASESSSSSCGLHFIVGEVIANENSQTTLNVLSGNKTHSTTKPAIPQCNLNMDKAQRNETEKVATTTSPSATKIPALAKACNQMTMEQLHRQLVSMDEKEMTMLQSEIEEIRKKVPTQIFRH